MQTSRREFIRITGWCTAGFIMLPDAPLSAKVLFTLPRKSPESQGVESGDILNFLKAIKESGLEWHSFMLVRHGNIVAEGWWKPFEPEYKHTLYSLSKSFTSTAIGFMVKEGKITVDDPVMKFFPEDLPQNLPDNLKSMKVKHLLTMNTGQSADTLPPMRDNTSQSWVKTFLSQPVEHEPGSFFLYNTGATYMLGAIVHKVTGELLETYLKPRLMEPLGITGYDWEKSPDGLNTAGYGLRVSTEDIARFGQFYLQKGKWNGKQLLPESWIEEATSKQTESQKGDNDWSQGYGYQFWRCKPGFYRGDGAFGQFCMVMPEQDAVLVMTCESFDLQKSMNVAYQTILPALKNTPLPENPLVVNALKNELNHLELSVPRGSKASKLMSKYSNKFFKTENNSFGIAKIGFGLFEDAGVIRIVEEGSHNFGEITFGWEKWKVNKSRNKNYFPVNNRTAVPSKIAATGTWLNENTLQVNLKFVEGVHGDKLTFVFEDNKVTLSLLNSVAENAKNTPEKREKLTGILA